MWNCKLLCLQCLQNLTVPIVLCILFTWSSALIPHFHHNWIPVVTLLIQVQRATKVLPHFPLIGVLPTVPHQFFPEDKFPPSDDESDDSLVDFDIDPKSENVNKKRAVFQVAEIPFNTLAQMIQLYLESVNKDPSKPVWPVPDMDRNQKRHFRRKAEKFKLVNGSLRHHHIYMDEKNKVKRGMYYRDVDK